MLDFQTLKDILHYDLTFCISLLTADTNLYNKRMTKTSFLLIMCEVSGTVKQALQNFNKSTVGHMPEEPFKDYWYLEKHVIFQILYLEKKAAQYKFLK